MADGARRPVIGATCGGLRVDGSMDDEHPGPRLRTVRVRRGRMATRGGREVRVPKAFVNLVETAADRQVRGAQDGGAFALIERLTGQPAGAAGA